MGPFIYGTLLSSYFVPMEESPWTCDLRNGKPGDLQDPQVASNDGCTDELTDDGTGDDDTDGDSLAAYLETVTRYEAIIGNSKNKRDPEILKMMYNLALAYRRLRQLTAAVAILKDMLETLREVSGADDLSLTAMGALGRISLERGDIQYGISVLQGELESRRKIQGDDHPDTLNAMHDLGEAYYRDGMLKEAANIEHECLERSWRIFGPAHLDTLVTAESLLHTLAGLDRINEIEDITRRFADAGVTIN